MHYVIKRAVVLVITAFVVICINFFIPRLMPGDPLGQMIGRLESLGVITTEGGAALLEAYKERFGFDEPLTSQFLLYLQGLLRGDLGVSIMSYPSNVTDLLARSYPWTIGLLTVTALTGWTLGNLIGVLVGWGENRWYKKILFITSLGLSQIPYYIFALLLVYLFSYVVVLFPAYGGYSMGATPGFNIKFITDVIWHSTLPALSIILVSVGGWMLGMRSMITSIIGEDYLLFAEAKGLKKNYLMMKYALRNALLPQVTGLGLSLGFVVSGALILEQIYAYPGIGSLFFRAFQNRDYNVMQGCFLVTMLGVLSACFILDVIYPLIDPRIRYVEE